MAGNQFAADVKDYLEYIKNNFSKSTYQEKRRKLKFHSNTLYDLFKEKKISSCNPRKITARDLDVYVIYRRSMGIKDSTIRKDLSMIGDVLNHYDNNAKAKYDRDFGNRKPKSYEGRLPPLPNETIEQVYDLARRTTSWPVLEGCVAIILGCASGLRPQEVRMLYVKDVHYDSPRPTIHVEHVKGEGKWGRSRNVPINDGVEDILEKYIRMREVQIKKYKVLDTGAMFPPCRTDDEFITQQSLGKLKDRVARTLDTQFVLKDARRAFGQRMLDAGVPIEYVSKCMGHASVVTTQRYYADYQENQVLNSVFGIMGGGKQKV